MKISTGDILGDYRILEELGRGGMGRVFKVEHSITRRLEALKVLECGRPDVPEEAERSLREIRLQAKLDHPNIAAVHNAFWAGDNLILVMELVEGRSLCRVLESEKVSLPVALNYAIQALESLQHAHANGVIHRDVSPANMIMGSGGTLKLTDFGLAKAAGDVRNSRSGAPLGSLWYMSPEQVRGEDATTSSDIYSLGAALYELATGKRPHDGDSAFAIMASQVEKPPAPPIDVNPEVPIELNAAILRALEKEPARRFRSADQFLEVLRDLRAKSLVGKPEAVRRATKRRIRIFAGLIAAAAGATVGVLLLNQRNVLHTAPPPVFKPQTNPSEQRDTSSGKKSTRHDSSPQQPHTLELRNTDASDVSRPFIGAPASANSDREDSQIDSSSKGAAVDPNNNNKDATSKRSRNRFVRAISKVWHLGRHRKAPAEEEAAHLSENPETQ